MEEKMKVFGKHTLYIMVPFLTLQVGFLIAQYAFGVTSFLLLLLLTAGVVLTYAFLKDGLTDDQKGVGLLLMKVSLSLFLLSTTAHIFLSFIYKIGKQHQGAPVLLKLSLLISTMFVILLVMYFKSKDAEEMFDNVKETSIWDKINQREKEVKPTPGDVIMCQSVDEKGVKKDVVWKFKDRFLHLLALGPTGSGKTSQILFPLINQDMQNTEAGLTIIEPKGDFAEKVHQMAEHYGRKSVYFNPILPDCPYFNPLFGKEEDVVENMATTFKMLNPDSPQFFLDMNETLIRNSILVLKRLYGNKANFIELFRLIHNSAGAGRSMVSEFSRLPAETPDIEKENTDIAAWFLNDYLNEKSKTYEHCSSLRAQVSKLTSNKYLRRVLNPPNGENDVDFDKHLEEGGVIAISTAQGDLRDLGRFLGYFVILQFQSSVFKRPGNENTRRAHFLYIDEFQTYANPGFSDMLTQGRSYRVASHLATQNRALIGMNSGKDGKNFVELVSTNARNVVIFPGANALDAKYYSEQFGQRMEKTVQTGVSRQKFNPLRGGIKPMSYDTESIREVEALEYRFTPSDIIYRPFGEITYCLIDNNSVQEPAVGTISYIPRDLNEKLDQMVAEYNAVQSAKSYQANPTSEVERNSSDIFQPEAVMIDDLPSIEERAGKKKEMLDFRKVRGEEVDASDEYVSQYVEVQQPDDEDEVNLYETFAQPSESPAAYGVVSQAMDDIGAGIYGNDNLI